jgi:thioredoxin-like negative regulator of GroEL
MRTVYIILFLFQQLFSKTVVFASSSLSTKNTHVVELTDENFEHLTQASAGQTTGKWFVNFSSPLCPHCVSLAPKWVSLAQVITKEHQESSVIVGMVDVTKNPKLVQRFNVKSMPTIFYFADRGMYQYAPNKPREVEQLLEYVLGGYKDDSNGDDGQEKMEVPATSRTLKVIEDLRRSFHGVEAINVILNDIEDIVMLRKNAAILLFGAGVLMGVLMCMLKNAIFGAGRAPKVKKD